ncbi:MAG TPA: hypothetical protein VMH30_12280 [Verrucomicrobiae bacterium]|nr:hypothetical protein [Verrucomicrobiae bacterium]
MKKFQADFLSMACCLALLAAWLLAAPTGLAADTTNAPSSEPFDFAKPKLLTATLYAIGSDEQNVLYTFRRTATRSNNIVHVERQFIATNGSVAAVEKIVYDSGRLVSYEMQEFQAQVSGAIRIAPDPKNPARQQLIISYGPGLTPPPGAAESLPPNTVIDDTLYPFMLAHWDDLMRGKAVKFHFVSLDRKRTYEFRLVKTAEFVRDHQTVEQIKMEAVSFLVAEFINPIILTVEKASPHHILSYLGRTTPRVKKGKAWKYLDAETVYHWS